MIQFDQSHINSLNISRGCRNQEDPHAIWKNSPYRLCVQYQGFVQSLEEFREMQVVYSLDCTCLVYIVLLYNTLY
jgi:hypothetical protein